MDINQLLLTITAVAGAIAAIVSLFNRHKLQAVHILMNSRMDKALNKIDELQGLLSQSKADGAVTQEKLDRSGG